MRISCEGVACAESAGFAAVRGLRAEDLGIKAGISWDGVSYRGSREVLRGLVRVVRGSVGGAKMVGSLELGTRRRAMVVFRDVISEVGYRW